MDYELCIRNELRCFPLGLVLTRPCGTDILVRHCCLVSGDEWLVGVAASCPFSVPSSASGDRLHIQRNQTVKFGTYSYLRGKSPMWEFDAQGQGVWLAKHYTSVVSCIPILLVALPHQASAFSCMVVMESMLFLPLPPCRADPIPLAPLKQPNGSTRGQGQQDWLLSAFPPPPPHSPLHSLFYPHPPSLGVQGRGGVGGDAVEWLWGV